MASPALSPMGKRKPKLTSRIARLSGAPVTHQTPGFEARVDGGVVNNSGPMHSAPEHVHGRRPAAEHPNPRRTSRLAAGKSAPGPSEAMVTARATRKSECRRRRPVGGLGGLGGQPVTTGPVVAGPVVTAAKPGAFSGLLPNNPNKPAQNKPAGDTKPGPDNEA